MTGLVLSLCLSAPLGIFFVMESLEDEWYTVIKAYKFTIFESVIIYCVSGAQAGERKWLPFHDKRKLLISSQPAYHADRWTKIWGGSGLRDKLLNKGLLTHWGCLFTFFELRIPMREQQQYKISSLASEQLSSHDVRSLLSHWLILKFEYWKVNKQPEKDRTEF